MAFKKRLTGPNGGGILKSKLSVMKKGKGVKMLLRLKFYGWAAAVVLFCFWAAPPALGQFSCDLNRADMNCGGTVNLTDLVFLINRVFAGTGTFCDNPAIKGDLNCDVFRDGADVWLLMRCIFLAAGDSCPGFRPTIPDPRDSIIIESKTVLPGGVGSPALTLRVWITNKDPITHVTLPYEEKSLSGGAYLIVSNPRTFSGTVTRITTKLPSNLVAIYGRYNSSSPDSVTLGAFADPSSPSTLEQPNATRKLFWELKFDSVNLPNGQVQFDTIRILDNTVHFVDEFGTRIPVNFVKGVVTVFLNNKPNWTPIGNKSVTAGQLLAFTVSASDPDLTIPALSAAPLPAGASFVDTVGGGLGEFSWTPTPQQVGSHQVLFIASDGIAADSEQVTITVLADTLKSQKNGASPGDELGFAVAGGGDVDGDGFADYIVGAPGTDIPAIGAAADLVDAGSAFVYSGAADTLLLRINGPAAGERLGGSVGFVSDLNADGKSELLVGAPGAADSAGKVYLYSGATGTLLFPPFTGGAPGDRLGGSVGIFASDMNNDGKADFTAGAPGADPGGRTDAGSAYVYSGADGSPLFQKDGFAAGDRLGGSVGITPKATDVDGDNRADFVIGAEGANGAAGAVYAYSGLNGNLLFQKTGAASGDRLGGSVGLTQALDVDADGRADLAAGAPGTNASAGAVFVYSGATGNLLFQKNGSASGDRLGGSVGIAADVDADGLGDLIAGAPGATDSAGAVFVYSGGSGSLLFQKNGSASGDRLGGSVGIYADASGQAHFIVGAPNADPNNNPDAGSAFVFQTLRKGDLDGDGFLTSTDVVLMLNCVFLGVGDNCRVSVADLDCEGFLTSTDVVMLLNGVFLDIQILCQF